MFLPSLTPNERVNKQTRAPRNEGMELALQCDGSIATY